MLGADGINAQQSPSGIFEKLKARLGGSPASPGNNQHAKLQQILKELKSPTQTALKQYGSSAIKGGVLGLGAHSLANMGMKGYLNAKYDDDQLKLWNELAK